MALTSAERQQRYRDRRKDQGEDIINVCLNSEASAKLDELVTARGQTQVDTISEAIHSLWDKHLKPPPPLVSCKDCKHFFPPTHRCFRLMTPAMKGKGQCLYFKRKG